MSSEKAKNKLSADHNYPSHPNNLAAAQYDQANFLQSIEFTRSHPILLDLIFHLDCHPIPLDLIKVQQPVRPDERLNLLRLRPEDALA